MKITSATTRAFRLPLKERMISSKFTMTHRELVLLTVETDAGLAVVEALGHAAGFDSVRELDIGDPFNRLYELRA